MESFVNILSLNVGLSNSLAGLPSLISSHSVDLVLLQEVRLGSIQLSNMLGSLGFKAESNIDSESPSAPGTAVAWRESLPVEEVFTIVQCKAQMVRLGSYAIIIEDVLES